MEHKTGLENYYVIRGSKKMRFGYTTGSCAAAACKGAVRMLLGKEKLTSVPLMTPKGILLDLELHDICMEENQVTCAVKKDAGDDPDTTNGILVYATVSKTADRGITVDGGEGVGRVTQFWFVTEGRRSCHQSGAPCHDPEGSRGSLCSV